MSWIWWTVVGIIALNILFVCILFLIMWFDDRRRLK